MGDVEGGGVVVDKMVLHRNEGALLGSEEKKVENKEKNFVPFWKNRLPFSLSPFSPLLSISSHR